MRRSLLLPLGALLAGALVIPGCDDLLSPRAAFAHVLAGSSWTVATDSAPPPEALAAPQALVLYQGGSAAKDSVTLPDTSDLELAVRAFKNGTATNGYSGVVWLNYTTGSLTVDTTAAKHQRAALHRRPTFDPGWLVVVSKISGVQVRDSVYVRDAANPAPPPPPPPPPPDTTPPPPDTVTPPAPAPPPVDTTTPGTVESIVGTLTTSASVKALGGVFAQYEIDFTTYDEPQWSACGPQWDCIDYYDRAAIYYAWYRRTGDPKYLDRGNQVAVNFRDNYLVPNNYGLAHHWAMMDGVALHYRMTGDLKSQLAVARVGENFAWQVNGDPSGYFSVPTDLRINAYAIKSLLDAWLIKAPSNGQNTAGWPAVPDWAPVLRSALTKILSLRDADGQWRTAKCFDGSRVSHPFTVGLLYDALYRYYTQFEADPRILPAIKQSAEIMWRDDWLPASGAFKYVGKACGPEGTDSPAGDLNQLIVNGYAFVGKAANDATFRARADSIFAGGVNSRGVTGDAKHLNQQYSSSYRYLTIRQAIP